jgi:hypothetical protein
MNTLGRRQNSWVSPFFQVVKVTYSQFLEWHSLLKIFIVCESTVLKKKTHSSHRLSGLFLTCRKIRKGLVFKRGMNNLICHEDILKLITLHNIL